MKKLILLLVFLFSMLNGNEIAWKQNISNGVQYHVKCSNGEQSDIFYYYDSKRYFVGGVGNYATLDSAKQHACKSSTSIVTIKKGAVVISSLKRIKKALQSEVQWHIAAFDEGILTESVNVRLLKIYPMKGKKISKSSNRYYIDDIVKISDDGTIYFARKSEVIF